VIKFSKEEIDGFKVLVNWILPAFIIVFSIYYWGIATELNTEPHAKLLVIGTNLGLISLYMALPIKTDWKTRVISVCAMASLILISFSAVLTPTVS
jgi:ABC-type multidrug transport system permease subunit